MSPRILILSLPDDVHALAVASVLQAAGVACDIWHQTDFPVADRLSLRLSPGGGAATRSDRFGPIEGKVVWSRRFSQLALEGRVHAEDLEASTRECSHFLNAMRYSLSPDAFWINPYHTEFFATSKAVQLRLADRCGLRIPDTLMSNDMDAVRAFLRRHERAIYKPYYPAQWRGDSFYLYAFARVVTEQELDDPDALRFCPGIFQPQIEKAYEARVTVMGREIVAARIDARREPGEVDDWRAMQIRPGGMRLTPIDLPGPVAAACFRLMEALGIVFGCFDFIIDPEGRWHFLEVNPAGQFLWVEVECPEIHMLETFCNFLLHGAADFRLADHARLSDLRLADVFDDPAFERLREQTAAAHIPTPHPAFGKA